MWQQIYEGRTAVLIFVDSTGSITATIKPSPNGFKLVVDNLEQDNFKSQKDAQKFYESISGNAIQTRQNAPVLKTTSG